MSSIQSLFLSDITITDSSICILAILKHYFQTGLKADKAAHRI